MSCAAIRIAMNKPFAIISFLLGLKVFIGIRFLNCFCVVGLSFPSFTGVYTELADKWLQFFLSVFKSIP